MSQAVAPIDSAIETFDHRDHAEVTADTNGPAPPAEAPGAAQSIPSHL